MKSNQTFSRPLLFILAILFALSGGVFSTSQSPPVHAQDDIGPVGFGIQWSPDGQWIAVPSNDGLWMVNAEIVERAPLQYFAGSVIPAIAFDPIRDRMAVYDETARLIRIIEPATGEIIINIEVTAEDYEYVYELAYSNDGKLLAAGSYTHLRIFDAITNHERQVYDSSVSAITSGIEPGTMIVGSFNGPISTFGINEDVFARSSFTPDDLTLYETMFSLRMLPDTSDGIALRGTGLINFNLQAETSSLLDPAFEEWVRGFEMNHAADTLAISQDGQMSFYDLPSATITQQIVTPNAEDQVIFGISFSPDDSRMVTLETTGTIYIWDVAEARIIVTWKNNFTRAFSQKWG
ncbi:MAG: WD40 repeat domain-containing protein [Anaerolineae bacterium]|nr:MAG: WD40 repeat domain-containing protein [Anaerolineae bacterium]